MEISFRTFFVLTVIGLAFYQESVAISCYDGSSTSSTLDSSVMELDPTKAGATLNSTCDYCSMTKSIAKAPVVYGAIHWGCELFGPNNNEECTKYLMKSNTTKVEQETCTCCEDKCNEKPSCDVKF